jgi:hypothetical protein
VKALDLMHPGLLRSSGWRYATRLRDLMAARWAGCLAQFDDLPHHRQIDVVAAYEVSWRVEAVNAWEALKTK